MIKAMEENGEFIDVVVDPSHYLYKHTKVHPWLRNVRDVKPACDGEVYISYEVKVKEYGCGCILFFLRAPQQCPRGHPAR